MFDLSCPNCQSDNTQKLSLAVQAGTFSNEGMLIGAGFSGHGLSTGRARTKGSSTSQFAQKNAAPQKLASLYTFFGVLFLSALMTVFAGPIAFQIGFWLAIASLAYCIYHNIKVYPTALAEWEALFVCQKCAHIFSPDQNYMKIGEAPD